MERKFVDILELRIAFDRAKTDYKYALPDELKKTERALIRARERYLEGLKTTVGYQSSWDYKHYLGEC